GLGAGGVQLQDRFGKVTHPGVSSAEMAFLLQIPVKARYFLINLLGNTPYNLAKENIHLLADAVVLDNRASPTINANLLCA
ncbi:glucosylglycerol 3-phosphatase, partial [Gilvimarinus sp. 1_MG-2023]